MKITKEELAAMLDGREYPFEPTDKEIRLAKAMQNIKNYLEEALRGYKKYHNYNRCLIPYISIKPGELNTLPEFERVKTK